MAFFPSIVNLFILINIRGIAATMPFLKLNLFIIIIIIIIIMMMMMMMMMMMIIICIAQIPYNVQMRFTIKLHSPKIGYNN